MSDNTLIVDGYHDSSHDSHSSMDEVFVSEEKCITRYKSTWRMVTSILVLTATIPCFVGWAIWSGKIALEKASEAEQMINIHIAESAPRDEAIHDSLVRIERVQERMSERINKLIEKQ